MDAEIAKSGGPWLLGKDISLADVMVMPAIVRMADLGQDGAWQDLPRVQRWYDGIRAHPAFAPTYYPGSLLTERFPHLRKIGGLTFIRRLHDKTAGAGVGDAERAQGHQRQRLHDLALAARGIRRQRTDQTLDQKAEQAPPPPARAS